MSDVADPLEVFRELADAIAGGDLDRAMQSIADDVVLDWSRSRGPLQGTYEGHAICLQAVVKFDIDAFGRKVPPISSYIERSVLNVGDITHREPYPR